MRTYALMVMVTLAAFPVMAQEAETAPAESLQMVESSVIDEVGYDEATQALTLKFDSGETYEYKAVPKAVYDELMAAESKGQYFQKNIKGKYEFQKK